MKAVQTAWNRFWFQNGHPIYRIRALKFLLYGLAAYDMWALMIEHASRYGAGGFNVAQNSLFALLPMPEQTTVLLLWLFGGFMALRAAFGIHYRLSASLAAVTYLTVYFWSQADSYQHHYLVGLLLGIGAFLPERGAEDEGTHWAVPLVYVQMAILYFWTAVTKCDPTWLTGVTMDQLTGVPTVRATIAGLATDMGMSTKEFFGVVAWATVLGEFFAAIAFLVPRLRLLGMLIVPWFHIGVEVLGFDIEIFSYYMIALDVVLLSPAVFWLWLKTKPIKWPAFSGLSFEGPLALSFRLALAAICGGTLCFLEAPIAVELCYAVAIVIALPIVWRAPLRLSEIVGNPLVVICLLVTVTTSESIYDFYRMWGGDLRRRGQTEDAIEKYERANALKPDQPARRMQLGRLYEKVGRQDDAHILYEASYTIFEDTIALRTRATFKDPTNHDAFIALAEDSLRFADRCIHMVKVATMRGEDPGQYRSARSGALVDIEAALTKAEALQPEDRRQASKLRRQLRNARKQSP